MRFLLTAFLTILFLSDCTNAQSDKSSSRVTTQKTIDNFQYSYKTAHPNAKGLMTDDFYWSPIEETAPFGSDDGFDAAYGFREWRSQNPTTSPVTYLKKIIIDWNYPYFDYNEMDTIKIKDYILSRGKPNEVVIQLQMIKMREAFENSPDNSMKRIDDSQLRDIIVKSSKDLGATFLVGQDNAIIGIAFSQFVLEGRMDVDIKDLTKTAINRQLLPMLLSCYTEKYRETRKHQLTKMLEVLNKVNS